MMDGTERDWPAERDSEQLIIAAALSDNSLAITLDLAPEEFGDALHQRLWGHARAVVAAGRAFSIGPIVKQMPELEAYLRMLIDSAAYAKHFADVPMCVKIVKEAALRRRLRELALGLAEQLEDPSETPEELLAAFIGGAGKMAARPTSRTKRAVAERIVRDLMRPAPYFETGLAGLDRAIGGGAFAGKLYGFAARKKVGKTALLGTISHNLNRRGVPHGYICLEMSDVEIEQRNMARDLGINPIQFLTRQMQGLDRMAADYAARVGDCTVFEHRPGASLDELRAIAGNMVTNHGVKGIIWDYWQLVGGKPKGESEEYHLRNAAQWFADFCRTHEIFGLTAAQENQTGNTRGGEGLKLACDIYFTLHREKSSPLAWLEMEESRYVLYANVGSEAEPGLILNPKGVFFEDPALPAEQVANLPL
jgi:replicative DNA helicase